MNSFTQAMKNLILVLIVWALAGCASLNNPEKHIQGYVAYKTAPAAKQMLLNYLSGDEMALANIQAPLASLTKLYEALKGVDPNQTLFEFAVANPEHTTAAALDWRNIVDIVNRHSDNHGTTAPDELKAFDANVREYWGWFRNAILTNDRTVKVRHYAGLILHILAARKGVILPVPVIGQKV